MKSYRELREMMIEFRRQGRIGTKPTDAERADWAYGNAKVDNPAVTREMAADAVAKRAG